MAPEVLPPPQTIEVGKAVIINEQTVVRETEEETGITVEPILELHLEEMILTRWPQKRKHLQSTLLPMQSN